jgi:minor extracellular serine protease Vpr
VARGFVVSLTTTIPLNAYSPGFFEYTDAGNQQVVSAALDVNYHLIGAFNPVAQGGVAQIYINGLGPVDQQQFSGYPAALSPAPKTTATPLVSIGGVNAPVQFSGLSPNSIGLYQVNVQVPTGIGAGLKKLSLSIGGVAAKDSQISVK